MSFTKHPAKEIVADLLDTIVNRGEQQLVVFLSGGSLLPQIQEVVNQLADKELNLDGVTWALVDERYSSDPQHADSNFRQLTKLDGIDQLQAHGLTLQPVLEAGKSLEETAKSYASYVKSILADTNVITLAILSAGEDFHTGGILPHKFQSTAQFYDELVVGYVVDRISDSDNPHRQRITLTFAAIEQMNEVWLFAAGETKQLVVDVLLNSVDGEVTGGDVATRPVLFLSTLDEVRVYK